MYLDPLRHIEAQLYPPIVLCRIHRSTDGMSFNFNYLDRLACRTCLLKERLRKKMFGPNISNPMDQSGRFVPLQSFNPTPGEINMSDETIRGQILDTAKGLTTGDRNKSYGPPIDNLTTYANLCSAYLNGLCNPLPSPLKLDAVDAAIFMVLAKVSRIAANRGHKDNYVDGAAYMAIAGECDELLGGTQ